MNILFFLTPKSDVAYIFEDETLRQTVEKMEHRKFSCIPILNKEGKYTGTISEGDLLWGRPAGRGRDRGRQRAALLRGQRYTFPLTLLNFIFGYSSFS